MSQLELFPPPGGDDNLIRLMLQPPKTGKDDPLFKDSEIINRKLYRKRYKA